MEVTGHQLREAISVWELMRDASKQSFGNSIFKFEDEDKDSPLQLSDEYQEAEENIASLQAAQVEYNLNLEVSIDEGEPISLCHAIKLIGAVQRMSSLWNVSLDSAPSLSLYSSPNVREKDSKYAVLTISADDVLEEKIKISKRLSVLRAAVAAMNNTKMDIIWLNPLLLE